ncbi:hypothetical protein Btru_049815 [Bulinus truncatus]|nr:hypothetical protein Btru_049815 [Bulinus truncatus]
MLTLINHQISLPVTVVMTVICLLKVMARPETCTLGEQVYQVGETWSVNVKDFGENCINCTCLPGGELDCQKPVCTKPKCEEPKTLRGQCCPSCEVGTDATESLEKMVGCDFQGEHFEHQEVFPSNKTALKHKKNHCVLCECYNGYVMCHLKACLGTPGCKKMVASDDDCCLHCAMSDSKKPKAQADCRTALGIEKNGTRWTPKLETFGEMKCFECFCLNGNVNCQKLKCPERSKLSCDDPVPDQDGCCRECPANKIKRRKKKENKNCKNSATPAAKENCLNSTTNKHNRKRPNKDEVTVSHKNVHYYDVINKLCVPKSAERIVYYSKGDNFMSLSFDDIKNNTIYQTYWELKNNRIQKIDNRTIIMPDEFRRSVSLTDILGAIDSKREKAFWKKLNKRQGRCKKKCRRKLVETSIRKLKIIKIDLSKKKCQL